MVTTQLEQCLTELISTVKPSDAEVCNVNEFPEENFPEQKPVYPHHDIPDRPEFPTRLRTLLDECQRLPNCSLASHSATKACWHAFTAAEEAAWDVFQDSMLQYGQASREPLDLLEIYAESDSRLTQAVNDAGGRARRFTRQDGDLSSIEGHRLLYDMIQRHQPKHIMMAPECRLWGSWSVFNSSRSTDAHQRMMLNRRRDQVHLRLCARLCRGQVAQGRHFHLEQPEQSRMLQEPSMQPVRDHTKRVVVDMCAFGLRTPVTLKPIRKRTVILSSNPKFVEHLSRFRCPGNHQHQQIAGRIATSKHQTVATSKFASAYCRGFAHVLAQLILGEQAFALGEDINPRTRKRFKAPDGSARPAALPKARGKREAGANPAGQQRSRPVARTGTPANNPEPEVLDSATWKPWFDLAANYSPGRGTHLISPEDDIFSQLRSRLPEYDVLQAFLRFKTRTLLSPVGALPSMVAPLRVSIAQAAGSKFLCFGKEERAEMSPARAHAKVPSCEMMVTIMCRLRVPQKIMSKTNGNPEGESAPPSEQDPIQHTRFGNVPSSGAEELPPNLEAWAPPPTPLHGPAFRALSRESKAELIRIHKNLRHPAPDTLARHLLAAQADPKLVAAARDFQCDVCLETTQPRHQRPGKLPEAREFNQLIGIDGFHFTSKSGYKAYVIHVIDEASCFHMGRRVPSHHTAPAAKLVSDMWFSWAGTPKKVYVDPAGEFRSEEWLSFLQGANAQLFVTTEPWQRGRIERHGDVVKHMLERLDADQVISSEQSFDAALLQCFQAKNALVRHPGYAPEQIVLGKSVALPGSNTSDESTAAHLLSEGQDLESEQQRQRLELRCRARQAFCWLTMLSRSVAQPSGDPHRCVDLSCQINGFFAGSVRATPID